VIECVVILSLPSGFACVHGHVTQWPFIQYFRWQVGRRVFVESNVTSQRLRTVHEALVGRLVVSTASVPVHRIFVHSGWSDGAVAAITASHGVALVGNRQNAMGCAPSSAAGSSSRVSHADDGDVPVGGGAATSTSAAAAKSRQSATPAVGDTGNSVPTSDGAIGDGTLKPRENGGALSIKVMLNKQHELMKVQSTFVNCYANNSIPNLLILKNHCSVKFTVDGILLSSFQFVWSRSMISQSGRLYL
jgi:uncharacterized protein (UPF0248 family)